MPATFIPDTIEGAQLDFSTTVGHLVRTGIIRDIPSTGSNSDTLLAALTAQGMPRIGVDTYPGTTLIFNRLLAVGFSSDGLKVALYHDTFQSIMPSAYIIRDHSSMSSRTTQFDLITKQMLRVSYDGSSAIDTSGSPGGSGGSGGAQAYAPVNPLNGWLCTADILQPLRQISVTRVGPGHPAVVGRKYFGQVNDGLWPGNPGSPQLPTDDFGNPAGLTQINGLWTTPAPVGDPLPAGYWLFSECQTDWTMYQNYFTTELSAISMVNTPWWQILTAQDPQSGQYARPRSDTIRDAIVAALANYTPGWQPFNNDGFGIYSPYPVAPFPAIFGF